MGRAREEIRGRCGKAERRWLGPESRFRGAGGMRLLRVSRPAWSPAGSGLSRGETRWPRDATLCQARPANPAERAVGSRDGTVPLRPSGHALETAAISGGRDEKRRRYAIRTCSAALQPADTMRPSTWQGAWRCDPGLRVRGCAGPLVQRANRIHPRSAYFQGSATSSPPTRLEQPCAALRCQVAARNSRQSWAFLKAYLHSGNRTRSAYPSCGGSLARAKLACRPQNAEGREQRCPGVSIRTQM